MTALSEYFAAQAQWRWQKAEEYPEDERNAQSARALESLAEHVAAEEDSDEPLIAALKNHLDDSGFVFGGEEVNRAVARYGFDREATKPIQHLDFLEELHLVCLDDAYKAAAEGDGDPTGTLFGFEIEAAEADVYLPRRYWENRRHRLEQELEAEVVSYRD